MKLLRYDFLFIEFYYIYSKFYSNLQLVHISWVQPRVLDKNQLSTMQQRLMAWCRDIGQVEQMIEKTGQEIIISAQ